MTPNKTHIKSIKITLIFIVYIASYTSYGNSETVLISTAEYPPGYSEYSPYYGYAMHVVIESFSLVGVKVNPDFVSWKRAYEDAKEGKRYDATCCWFLSKDRTDNFHISEPVTVEGFSFFHLKSYKFNWNNLNDLAGINIGASRGYTLGDDFYAAEKHGNLKVQWVKEAKQSLGKLLLGRVDIVPLDSIVGYELLRNSFSPQEIALVTHHSKPLRRSTTHLLFPKTKEKNSKRLQELFNKGLKELKKSGKHKIIIENAMNGKYKVTANKWKDN